MRITTLAAFYFSSRVDEAIAQWQKALVIQPQDGEVYTSLGNAFSERG
jgi:Flp pilus assembly protein TadD